MKKKPSAIVFDKATLFAAMKPKEKTVEFEGYGPMKIFGMSARVKEAATTEAKEKKVELWVFWLIRSVFDIDGNVIFDENDVDQLLDSGNAQIEYLMNEVLIVNGIKKEADEKNLPATQKDDSSSA